MSQPPNAVNVAPESAGPSADQWNEQLAGVDPNPVPEDPGATPPPGGDVTTAPAPEPPQSKSEDTGPEPSSEVPTGGSGNEPADGSPSVNPNIGTGGLGSDGGAPGTQPTPPAPGPSGPQGPVSLGSPGGGGAGLLPGQDYTDAQMDYLDGPDMSAIDRERPEPLSGDYKEDFQRIQERVGGAFGGGVDVDAPPPPSPQQTEGMDTTEVGFRLHRTGVPHIDQSMQDRELEVDAAGRGISASGADALEGAVPHFETSGSVSAIQSLMQNTVSVTEQASSVLKSGQQQWIKDTAQVRTPALEAVGQDIGVDSLSALMRSVEGTTQAANSVVDSVNTMGTDYKQQADNRRTSVQMILSGAGLLGSPNGLPLNVPARLVGEVGLVNKLLEQVPPLTPNVGAIDSGSQMYSSMTSFSDGAVNTTTEAMRSALAASGARPDVDFGSIAKAGGTVSGNPMTALYGDQAQGAFSQASPGTSGSGSGGDKEEGSGSGGGSGSSGGGGSSSGGSGGGGGSSSGSSPSLPPSGSNSDGGSGSGSGSGRDEAIRKLSTILAGNMNAGGVSSGMAGTDPLGGYLNNTHLSAGGMGPGAIEQIRSGLSADPTLNQGGVPLGSMGRDTVAGGTGSPVGAMPMGGGSLGVPSSPATAPVSTPQTGGHGAGPVSTSPTPGGAPTTPGATHPGGAPLGGGNQSGSGNSTAPDGPVPITVGEDTYEVNVPDTRIGEMMDHLAQNASPGNPVSVLDAAKATGTELADYGSKIDDVSQIKPGDIVHSDKGTGFYMGDGKVLTETGEVKPLGDVLDMMSMDPEAGVFRPELPEVGEDKPEGGASHGGGGSTGGGESAGDPFAADKTEDGPDDESDDDSGDDKGPDDAAGESGDSDKDPSDDGISDDGGPSTDVPKDLPLVDPGAPAQAPSAPSPVVEPDAPAPEPVTDPATAASGEVSLDAAVQTPLGSATVTVDAGLDVTSEPSENKVVEVEYQGRPLG